MFFLLISSLFLLVLPGNLQQEKCRESQYRDVRLQGGTEYIGRVEVCWQDDEQYMWMSVCNTRWGNDEASAVCQQLNYTNSTVTGRLTCRGDCFGQGTEERVMLRCPKSDCTMDSVMISSCDNTNNAEVICGLPLLSPPTQCSTGPPGSMTTQDETRVARRANSCPAVGGALGAVIIAMLIVLVGMLLGWVWSYYRKSNKQRLQLIESSTQNEGQMTNSTYDMTTYHTEKNRPSFNGGDTTLDHTPGMTPASAGTYDILQHPDKSGGEERMYHVLERPTPEENTDTTYHMLEEAGGGNYALINANEQGQSYEIPLQTTATPAACREYDKLQHKQ